MEHYKFKFVNQPTQSFKVCLINTNKEYVVRKIVFQILYKLEEAIFVSFGFTGPAADERNRRRLE